MSEIHDIVLVGGGLAAAKAAESLREEGYDGSLALVTDEPERPYERPPLSKGVLAGEKEPDVVYVHEAGFYAEHDIELVTGDAVVGLDTDAGSVTTASGRSLRFDRLLLATGAAPRALPLDGADSANVVMLRTLADGIALRDRLAAVTHVTVVGAGWIGSEVAAAARGHGAEVTLVDPLDVPLQRVLGGEVGGVFADLHREHGVDLRLGVGVDGLRGSGVVDGVVLSDGATVATDLVVVGIGVRPRVDLATDAGLDVDDGILVDATLRTSDERIFAAGDVANALHPTLGRRIRVEHWANALNQGEVVGRNLLGAGEAYDRLPYFFSDQYDLGMEYVGHASADDEVVIRGDRDGREFLAFWLRDGRVVAGMNVNVWDVVDDVKALIASGRQVDLADLGDPEIPLGDLLDGDDG